MTEQLKLLIACAVVALIALPLIFRLVPPNMVYGFRTRRTLADPALWYRANQFSGWALFVAASLSALLIVALPGPPSAYLHFLAPLAVALFASLVYLWRVA